MTPTLPEPADGIVDPPVDRVQRRTVSVLAASQVFGGIGVATGISVSSLIASELSGSDAIAGLAQTTAVVGAAIVALPLSRLAERHGRRRSLATGYVVAFLGALLAATATLLQTWPLLLAGMLLFGAGSATGLASRFTATDLARPERRATDLSVVIWATTIGSVLGPNLAGATEKLGLLPGPAGEHGAHGTSAAPLLVASLAFAAAAASVWLLLRPDPLHVAAARAVAGTTAAGAAPDQPGTNRAGARAPEDVAPSGLVDAPSTTPTPAPPRPGFRAGLAAGWAVIRASATAQLALAAIVVSHLVMVGLMSMTPVHMGHGGASLQIIGIVISAHIAGMYVLSPVIGWAADKVGHARVLVVGGAILLASAVIVAGAPSDDSARLTVGLVLLGVGWSCGLVAGSALLIDATPATDRTQVQGLSDFAMNLGGAVGGVLAGIVIAVSSYAALSWGAAVLLVAYLVLVAGRLLRKDGPRSPGLRPTRS
ncbi:MFS transporter [Oerskovia sp. NPDC057915]|uniref:MFS transporter n=1 Tax=Oerskovia sp. NPDC057915 TaxID=3346280 RepID=UPI0036DEFBE3